MAAADGLTWNSAYMRKAQPVFVIWALLFSGLVLVYWPALRGDPLWDDARHITAPALQARHGLWRIWFELGATQQYYPLLHSAFWLEHRLWGDSTLGYHLMNLALHAASACLVIWIMKRLRLPGAWLAGLIFAVHPVCVETVAWISEQKTTLSGVFCLMAALVYLQYDESRSRWHYFWGLALFIFALLCKTVTATLPAALLVVFWWKRGRLEWRCDVCPLAPWLVLGACAGLFTAYVEQTYIGAQGTAYSLTAIQHVLLAGRILWFYAAKLVWPAGLTFSYPRWDLDPIVWWQYLYPAGAILAASALVLRARWSRGPLAAFLLFAGTLFPVLGFLSVYPFRYSYVADHFQYLASIALIVPAAAILAERSRRFRLREIQATLFAVALLASLASLSWRQSRIYSDPERLYGATLDRNPQSWMAHNNLGATLAGSPDRLPEAVEEFRAALRLNPDDAQAHNNLGNVLARMSGRLSEAIPEFETALRLQPHLPEAHRNLGRAFALLPGREDAAIAELGQVVRLQPDDATAHAELAALLARVPSRQLDAARELDEAARLRGNSGP